jgi:hypothetical protein
VHSYHFRARGCEVFGVGRECFPKGFLHPDGGAHCWRRTWRARNGAAELWARRGRATARTVWAADCARTIHVREESFSDASKDVARARTWTIRCRSCVRGLNAVADCSRTWINCVCGLFLACPCRRNCRPLGRELLLLRGRSAAAPRLRRGHRNLRREGVTRALPKNGWIGAFGWLHVGSIACRPCVKDGAQLRPRLTKIVQVIHGEFSEAVQNGFHER